MYRRFFKRVVDFVVALVALVVLSPVLLVVTVWLHFANKGARCRPERWASLLS